MAEQNDRTESIAIRSLLLRLAAATLGVGDLPAVLREVRAEVGEEAMARAILEEGGGDRFETLAGNFERFAGLVAGGQGPDDAARAVGGTGRPAMRSSHVGAFFQGGRPPMSPVHASPEYQSAEARASRHAEAERINAIAALDENPSAVAAARELDAVSPDDDPASGVE